MKSFIAISAVALLVCMASAERPCLEVLEEMNARVQAGMVGVPVPKCEPNGDWSPLQCRASTGMCHCVHPTGEVLAKPNRQISTCECFQERHHVLQNMLPGKHIPECEETGYYKKLQCRDQYCWCADKKTGKAVTESVHISSVEETLKNCA